MRRYFERFNRFMDSDQTQIAFALITLAYFLAR
jgi:hypothetical protein